MQRRGLERKTVKSRLLLIFFTAVTPLILFIVFFNQYTLGIMDKQIDAGYKSMLAYFVGEIDSSLESINACLLLQYTDDYSLFYNFANAKTQSEYALYRGNLIRRFDQYAQAYPMTDNFFLFSDACGEEDYLFAMSDRSYARDRQALAAALGKAIKSSDITNFSNKKWELCSIDGEDYLIRFYGMKHAIFGACVNIRTFTAPLVSQKFDGKALFLPADEAPAVGGVHFVNASSHNNYQVVFRLNGSPLDVYMPIAQTILLAISLCLIFISLYMLRVMRRNVFRPLDIITDYMGRVQRGDMTARIPDDPTHREFSLMCATFNGMMDEIKRLKIEQYEEKLSMLSLQMQCLHMQIDPHFYLGTINTIYMLANRNETDTIRQMSFSFMNYLQSMFRNNKSLLTIGEEVETVRHYVNIQKLRLFDHCSLQADIPDYLSDIEIPTMSILTFVENAFKHTTDNAISLVIEVTASLFETAEQRVLTMRISDNGPGFSPDVLVTLNAGEQITDSKREHVGIHNVRLRMAHLYGDRASVSFSNRDSGGAVVEYKICL